MNFQSLKKTIEAKLEQKREEINNIETHDVVVRVIENKKGIVKNESIIKEVRTDIKGEIQSLKELSQNETSKVKKEIGEFLAKIEEKLQAIEKEKEKSEKAILDKINNIPKTKARTDKEIKDIAEKLIPKEKKRGANKVIDEIKASTHLIPKEKVKGIKNIDIRIKRNEGDIEELKKEKRAIINNYRGGSGGGATKLIDLTDVNLDNAEQDSEGKYIIGAGGSKLGFQNAQYDFSQTDYDYVGGNNKDGVFQINRYTKNQPITISYAFGDWNDRLTLTYTNI